MSKEKRAQAVNHRFCLNKAKMLQSGVARPLLHAGR